MSKILKNMYKELSLLLVPLIILFVLSVAIPYVVDTTTLRITSYIFVVMGSVGLLAWVKTQFTFRIKAIENTTDIILSVVGWFAFFIILIGVYIVSPILVVCLYSTKTEKFPHVVIYYFVKTSHFLLGIKTVYHGKRPQGVYIGALNHASSADYFISVEAFGPVVSKVVAGANLAKFPFVSFLLKIKAILVDRNNEQSKKILTQKVSQLFENNVPVSIFFEGGRKRLSTPGPLLNREEIKKGAFLWAKRYNIPIVPIVILDSGDFKPPAKGEPLAKKWWKFQWWSSPMVVHVYYLTSIFPESKSSEELTDEVYNVMYTCILENSKHF